MPPSSTTPLRSLLLLSAAAAAAAQCADPAGWPGGDPVHLLGEGELLDQDSNSYDVATAQSGADLIAANPTAYTNDERGCYDYCTAQGFTVYGDLVGIGFEEDATGPDPNLNLCTCYRQVNTGAPVGTHGDFNTGVPALGCAYCIGCLTTAPSEQPSKAPSEAPSPMPSGAPSGQPSSSPSEAPSGQPSSQPSEMPSASPSEAPSGQPSSSPSEMPSSVPSEAPSGVPSSSPSEAPSSVPSKQPSSQPSSSPSEAPSSVPSKQPSSQPSSQPSELPSCTPSMAPTDPETMHLYYPDWSPGGTGCVNDGNEPAYMSANPSWYLYSTLDDCCTTYFGWNYDGCMGDVRGTCVKALFYPDWEGSNEGCVDDGNEPPYMRDNYVYYMFANKEDCCSEHYNWNYDACVGRSTAIAGMYYPDFGGSEHICKNDGAQPQYMNVAPEVWMHTTLLECCTTNYNWNLDECLGTSPGASPVAAPTPAATRTMWYPDWLSTDHVCRNDGNEPAYMTQNPSIWMFDAQVDCCNRNYQWNYDACIGTAAAAAAAAPVPAPVGSGDWYMDWGRGFCVQDCDGAVPCGGHAQAWDNLYPTKQQCCDERNWWNDDCETS
ncbi:hypothetical protein ACHAXT_008979 [Thalassiosira profunda]